jgi:hypothetical protein
MSSEKASSSKETITNKSTVSSAPDQFGSDSINVGDIEGTGIAIGTGAIATVNNHYHYYTQAQLQQQFSPRVLELQLAAVSAELDRLSSDFSEKVTTELEEIRELERKGKVQSSRARTEELQHSENWRIFTKPLQAKVLRILAGYAITLDDDPSTASELLNQALLLDPEADTIFIRTLIRFRIDGIEAALAEINNISDISIVNLKLALLLEINRLMKRSLQSKQFPKTSNPMLEPIDSMP